MDRIYYDPFGMRLEGYRKGVQDETGLQEQTRRARVADYDFNTLQPLRTAQAQRQDQFEQAALPYNIRGLDIAERMGLSNLFTNENNAGQAAAQNTGDYGGVLANSELYSRGAPYYLGQSYNTNYLPLRNYESDFQANNPAMSQPTYGESLLYGTGVTPEQWSNYLGQGRFNFHSGQDQNIDQRLNFNNAIRTQEAQRLQKAQDWNYQIQQAEAQRAMRNIAIQQYWARRAMMGGGQGYSPYGAYGMPAQATGQAPYGTPTQATGQAPTQPTVQTDEYGFEF